MIKCAECNSRNNEFNEFIGETCCVDCGLVLTSILFEETTFIKKTEENLSLSKNELSTSYITDDGRLGSRIMGTSRLAKSQLWASTHYRGKVLPSDKHFTVLVKNIIYQYNISTLGVSNSILEQCESLKRTLREKNILKGYSTEIRAASITYLIIKNKNITNIKRHAIICGVNVKLFKKANKKFVKGMQTKETIQIRNPTLMMENSILMLETNIGEICNYSFRVKCFKMSEYVSSCYDELNLTYRNSTNALIMWLVSQMVKSNYTQKQIGNASDTTPQSLRINLKNFYVVFNITKEQLLSITVDDFISGIRGR
tara:strand:+ start:8605 stop:9543 length:939 start_codon:yes stop_codon:yes gene_type:complete